MYAIEDFLSEDRRWEGSGNYEVFLRELFKIPGYQEKFEKLVEADPEWLAIAVANAVDGNPKASYMLHDCPDINPGDNELALRKFSNNTEAVVKVIRYIPEKRVPLPNNIRDNRFSK